MPTREEKPERATEAPKYIRELSPLEKRLAASAAAASRDAIQQAFAAGLAVPVIRGRRLVMLSADGTEKLVKELDE